MTYKRARAVLIALTATATLGTLASGTPSSAAGAAEPDDRTTASARTTASTKAAPDARNIGTTASVEREAAAARNIRYVVARHSKKCLTVRGASHADNAVVNQYRCVGAKNQRWRLEMIGGDPSLGSAVLRNINSGKCLTVHGASTAKGAKLDQYTCVGAPNQTFTFIPAMMGQTPLFTQPLSGAKCVDVQGASKADNAPVLQWNCNRRQNQAWDLTRRA
ncbi:RICIN domain-containing protein [Streptomyces venezuelae]|uniref:RICIN domain-containing protein n=1 Tax=Streptomyces venezuelae TaxID=54571 RepID=UPI0037A0DCE2